MNAAPTVNLGLRLMHLPQEKALAEFPVLAPFLEKGVQASMGRISLESIHRGIQNGEFMPFVILDAGTQQIKAVILCEGAAYPHRSVFSISLCGGEDLDEWAHFYGHFRELAQRMDFDQLEVVGRPGWGRVLGLKPQVHTFVEELSHGKPDAEDER